ncbi:hypothetical protein ACTXKV_10815 [Psychrobacter cibarius]|uniref:hypothetical protein n=1 Tax=Psychrobacter TaxID=497 RepID=UPI001919A9DB|nr:hypothetical protein [Psychrobacter sp. Pi2-51]
MSILIKQFEAECNNYITLANIVILISDLTDTPISDAKTYFLNAHNNEALDVFKIDERMNFYQINLDETPLENHEDHMVNFRKADLASLAPIAKYNIFNAVDNDYFDNKTWTNDPVEDEFLTIDQTVEYIKSVTGITYHNKLLGSISERGQITPYFYDDSYIAKRIGNLYCEKIKGYFYFKNIGGFLARNDTRAFIGDNPILDVIYVRSLLFQSANEFKPGDAVNLYNFKPVDFESAEDALITSIHYLNFRFLKSEIDNYLKYVDNLRSYVLYTTQQELMPVNNELNNSFEQEALEGITRLLYVLLYKGKYNITSSLGTTNANIVKYSKTTLTRTFVSKWLKAVKKLDDEVRLSQVNLESIADNAFIGIEEINSRTRSALLRFLNILIKKIGYDIDESLDNVCTEIVKCSESLGSPVNKNFVHNWFNRVIQMRLDVSQEKTNFHK